ncbi:pseudouridylate synthase 1 homolog [Phlebotomus argentipes]|uniref:pseudouridylate synthase 1 homolog n=1 Tax=Phlebotomus argentipes TaxID=94469 RepID=UPI0028931688|nr:pseudouridylate synthase 1 homolog [Phlebotomus argentipes]
MFRLPLLQRSLVFTERRFIGHFANIMSEAIEDRLAKKIPAKKAQKNSYKPRYESRKRANYNVPQTEEAAKRACPENFVRIKRKKSVIMLGYSGKNYFGMQRNEGVKTVEEELLAAMLKHKWITDEAYNMPQSISFQRAARTDKGVSAIRQLVSLKLPLELNVAALNEDLPKEIRVFAVKVVTQGFNSKNDCFARTYTYTLPTIAFSNHADTEAKMETYRVPVDVLQRLRCLLKMFEGSKNYYNFTIKKGFFDPSANRYIMSFTCDDPFVVDGVEFTVIRVKGQSFMMHQIRKMVGLTLSILRGHSETKILETAFSDTRLYIPRAPGLGLVLDTLHYDRYNKRYGNDGIHSPLLWDEYEEEIQKFIREEVYPIITETEIKEKPFLEWLEYLSEHDFSGKSPEENEDNENEECEDEPVKPGKSQDVA